MAYVVGSVSVEVVPDFRNAQNAITAWFRSQPDQVRVPVRPVIDERAAQNVQAEARRVGNATGEAFAQGVEARATGPRVVGAAAAIERLEARIARATRQGEDAAKALQLAEARLDEARKAGNRSRATLLGMEQAVERQQQKIADSTRAVAEAQDGLVRAREESAQAARRAADAEVAAQQARLEKQRQAEQRAAEVSLRQAETLSARKQRAADRAAQAAQRAADRAREREVRESVRAIEKINRERLKAQQQALKDEERARAFADRDQIRQEKAKVRELLLEYKNATTLIEKEQIQIQIDERNAIIRARRAGGLVARSIHAEIRQNAGLIALAIGGTILAGAPAALAAASGLFIGVAAIAAAQSNQLRQTWSGVWDEIRRNSVADASSLIPAFERAGGIVLGAFRDIRPAIREMVDASVDDIDVLAGAFGDLARNAVPGFSRALQANDPVIRGTARAFREIGDGVSDFFDTLSEFAAPAGQAMGDFGELIGEALPLVAELVGQGARLANTVFPAVTSSLRGLNAILDSVGDVLPAIAAGFLAFRLTQGVGRFVAGMGSSLAKAAEEGGRFAGTQSKVSGVLNKVSGSLPVVGAALGLLAAGYQASEDQSNEWSAAILEGGSAARKAAEEMAALENTPFLMLTLGEAFDVLTGATEEARKKAEEYRAGLTPVERAQLDLKIATADLADALGDESVSAEDLQGKKDAVARAAANLKREQDEVALATRGVTEAMEAQADQSRKLVDSTFAYQDSVNDLEDAVSDYKEALKEGGEEEQARALLEVQKAYNDVGQAAYDVAYDSLPAVMDEQQKNILASQAQLDALEGLRSKYGDLGPAMNNHIAELEAIVGGADGAQLAQARLAEAFAEVGLAVESVPDSKVVRITDTTPEVRERLRGLGLTVVELPDGSVEVSADTKKAQDNLSKVDTVLSGLDGTRATTTIDANPNPFLTVRNSVVSTLQKTGLLKAIPGFDANPRDFDRKKAGVDRDLAATGRKKSVPTFDGNQTPFGRINTNVRNNLTNTGSRTSRPTFDGNSTPFGRVNTNVNSILNRTAGRTASPTISATDRASGIISRIIGNLANIPRNITSTITQRYVVTGQRAAGRGAFARDGGAMEDVLAGVPRYDIGGAVTGRGGPRDDLNVIRVSPGEHMFDARDVSLLGGQAGVYAFRRMLNQKPETVTAAISSMLSSTPAPASAAPSSRTVAGMINHGQIVFADEAQFYRQMEQRRREALVREGV